MELQVLDLLYIGAAVITVAGVLVRPIGTLLRRRTQRRMRTAGQAQIREPDLLQTIAEFTGAALGAHGRVVTLGRLRASWVPVSEQTAVRLGEPLLDKAAPIAMLRSRIRVLADEEANQAADNLLRVLEESADLLTKRKLAIRRVDWTDREVAIAEAVDALQAAARRGGPSAVPPDSSGR